MTAQPWDEKNGKQSELAFIAVINERTETIIQDIKEIKKMISDNYVTKNEFSPVRNVVYGMCAIVFTGFLVGVVALIIPKTDNHGRQSNLDARNP